MTRLDNPHLHYWLLSGHQVKHLPLDLSVFMIKCCQLVQSNSSYQFGWEKIIFNLCDISQQFDVEQLSSYLLLNLKLVCETASP